MSSNNCDIDINTCKKSKKLKKKRYRRFSY